MGCSSLQFNASRDEMGLAVICQYDKCATIITTGVVNFARPG